MIRKYHNHTPQTNPWHLQEETHSSNSYNTSESQLKQSNQPYLPNKEECNTRRTQSTV